MAHIEIDESGLDALYQQVAQSLRQIDRALRETWTGGDLETTKTAVRSALGAAGVQLPDEPLSEYAQSIVNNENFQFVLK